MNVFSKIRESFRKLSKTTIVAIAVLGILAGIGLAAKMVVAEWYPNRTPYDYNKPCNPNDDDKYDGCGSLEGPVFNSFINTPAYGDERAFLDARRSDQTTGSNRYKNVLPDVTEGSKEVVVRLYVHNNANQSTNASGLGVARNTQVRVMVPTGTNNSLRAVGYITADNADMVEDTVDFTATKDFSLSYVPGSAVMYNNRNKDGIKLSDSIVTTGAKVGSGDKADGVVKGCFEYEIVVELKLKVTPKDSKIKFDKQVALPGDGSNWKEEVSTKPGDTVKWLISFQNIGTTNLTKVNINDKLPPHVKVVPGTVKWIYTGTDGRSITADQNDTQFFTTGGLNFGDWKPKGGFYVRFDTKVLGDFEECEVTIRNVARSKSDQTKTIEDYADVRIKKDDCVPSQPEKPTYDCKAITLKELGGRKVRVSVTPTMTGDAKVKHYTYDFGDGSAPLLTDKDTVEHTYSKDGIYATRVKVAFSVGGKVKEVDSDNCAASVKFEGEQPKPEVLPVTGPANIVGIFVATSVAGAIAYNVVYRRYYL